MLYYSVKNSIADGCIVNLSERNEYFKQISFMYGWIFNVKFVVLVTSSWCNNNKLNNLGISTECRAHNGQANLIYTLVPQVKSGFTYQLPKNESFTLNSSLSISRFYFVKWIWGRVWLLRNELIMLFLSYFNFLRKSRTT